MRYQIPAKSLLYHWFFRLSGRRQESRFLPFSRQHPDSFPVTKAILSPRRQQQQQEQLLPEVVVSHEDRAFRDHVLEQNQRLMAWRDRVISDEDGSDEEDDDHDDVVLVSETLL